MDAIHIYQEFEKRTDDKYLDAFSKAIDNILSKNPINVFEIKILNDNLKERRAMALPPSRIVEMMASVYYFDETENPYKYDRAYGQKKIALWRKGEMGKTITTPDDKGETIDFFLSLPIGRFIPSFPSSSDSIRDYLKIADMVDWVHLQAIFDNLSSDQQKKISSILPYYTGISEKMKEYQSLNT